MGFKEFISKIVSISQEGRYLWLCIYSYGLCKSKSLLILNLLISFLVSRSRVFYFFGACVERFILLILVYYSCDLISVFRFEAGEV